MWGYNLKDILREVKLVLFSCQEFCARKVHFGKMCYGKRKEKGTQLAEKL